MDRKDGMMSNIAEQPKRRWSGFTIRSVLLGLSVAIVISIAEPYSQLILKSSLLTSDYLPLGAVFLFFVVVAGVNVFIKAVNRTWALTPPELAVVFVMGLISTTLPTNGLVSYLIGMIAAPYYYASPENHWAEYLHAHTRPWMVVDPRGPAVTWFWEGMPEGASIPWSVWIVPLFWWLSFIAVLFFVGVCVVVILRRQWAERERLAFPLAEVPAEMVQGSDSPSLMPRFMQGRVFWIGFLIPLCIVLWNIIGYFSPLFPSIPLRSSFAVGRDFPSISTYIFFPLIGFAYLINLDVSLSIWFFYVLGVIQIGLYNRIGYSIGSSEAYDSGHAAMGSQGFGAFVFMVLWGLWMGRRHLKDVFGKALDKNYSVDDSEELLSYRTAVFGLVFGLIYLSAWLMKSGMEPKVLVLFLPATFIIYIGVTRIVMEGGLVFLRCPMIGPSFAAYALGSSAISTPSMVSLAFTYMWSADIKSFYMTACMHAARLKDRIKVDKRAMFWAIMLSAVVTVVVTTWYTLWVGYHGGAFNFGTWSLGGGVRWHFQNIVGKMRNPFDIDWKRLMFMGIGAVVMAGLTFVRYRFNWWPVHPIGFTVASTLPIRSSVFSVFLGWAAKFVILKLGGIRAYRTARPFFTGMIMGYFTGAGISFVVDMIWFVGQGHNIYGW